MIPSIPVKFKNATKILDLQLKLPKIFGSWFWILNDSNFFRSDYFKNLMVFLFTGYRDSDKTFRPRDKFSIFKALRECDADYCHTVIVTEFPPLSDKSSGIGLGNKSSTPPYAYTQEALIFKNAIIKNLYDGQLNLHFDISLKDAANNGVLFLNTALTCTTENKRAHEKYWEPFIAHLLSKYETLYADKVFVFIGEAKKFAKYIDQTYHHVLIEEQGIDECVRLNKIWNTDIFSRTQKKLIETDDLFKKLPFI